MKELKNSVLDKNYKYPELYLLKDSSVALSKKEEQVNQQKIITTLENLGIKAQEISTTTGPAVSLYEITLKNEKHIDKIRKFKTDIINTLGTIGIRIIAPMPNKSSIIGIEIPNSNPQIVSMHEIVASKNFQKSKYDLPIALGRTISNEVFMLDLQKEHHLLIAGNPGQGKTNTLNTIITSLLYKKQPSQLKFVLINLKDDTFNIYNDINNLFAAQLSNNNTLAINDRSTAISTLNSLKEEMENRFELMKLAGVNNVQKYNEKFINNKLNIAEGHKYLPYIVTIIDEYSDFITEQEIAYIIIRLAQISHCVGIHMIITTQQVSYNVINGVIKANFPARIAFKVSNNIESKIIIDQADAEELMGEGDLLYLSSGNYTPERIQGALINQTQLNNIVKYISQPSQDLVFNVNGVQFKMVHVEGGTFTMGATSEQENATNNRAKPTHTVTLDSYYMGETQVTQALWQAVMGNNPSEFKAQNNPVDSVSWDDCKKFITKLNQITGQKFSLPTEAQWEFAARGGNLSQGYKYAGSNNLNNIAWFNDNSNEQTHPVAQKQPNELGLYDMSGNVQEWCNDRYGDYSSLPQHNPIGPSSGCIRVLRGGSWVHGTNECQVSFRDMWNHVHGFENHGFRLSLSL